VGSIEVAVIRALHLGDLICMIPAIRALRLAGPRSRIVLIGLPWASEFVARYPHYFDDLLEFPGWPGIPERELDEAAPARLAAFQSSITRTFDVVLQLHGDGRIINDFAATVPGRVHGGFVPSGTEVVPAFHLAYPDTLPEPLRLLAPLSPLGLDTLDPTLELPVFEADRNEAHALLAAAGAAGQPYVIVHPGGRGDDRRWPFARFAAVADALSMRGLRVVVTGSAAERPIADALAARTSAPVIDVVGRTSLGALAALVDEAQVVVTNDTGVSHVAAARQTPSVVVFVGSDPARWAPIDRTRHIALGRGLRSEPIPVAAEVIDAALSLVGAAA